MLAAMGRLKVVGCPFLGAAQNPHLIACFRCLEDLEVFDLAASELSNRVSPGGRKALAAGSRCCLYHFVSFCILDFGSADLLATRNDISLDSLGIKKNTPSQETSWSTVEPINNEHVSAIRLL
jgi:hypothetical protein